MGPIWVTVTERNIIHTTWYGTFLLSSEGKELKFIEAEKDPDRIAEDLIRIAEGVILDRERAIIDGGGIDAVTDKRLKKELEGARLIPLREIEVAPPDEKGFDISLLRDASLIVSISTSREGPDDSTILSGVGALTDIDSSLNLVTERMKEWYAKYWEDINLHLENKEVLSMIVEDPSPSTLYSRIDDEEMSEPKGEIPALDGLSALAGVAIALWDAREKAESYIEREMETTSPCLSAIAGPLIGARLIHSAGGLMRLAKLPASTVQVLGAEKMFFKFLKEGGKPPKHGVLFQHPWVHSLPVSKRGKMSRSIANAAALAARIDAYGEGDPEPLRRRLEKRREEIIRMEEGPSRGGGRQPPFREGWWADKPMPRKGRGNRTRGKKKRK